MPSNEPATKLKLNPQILSTALIAFIAGSLGGYLASSLRGVPAPSRLMADRVTPTTPLPGTEGVPTDESAPPVSDASGTIIDFTSSVLKISTPKGEISTYTDEDTVVTRSRTLLPDELNAAAEAFGKELERNPSAQPPQPYRETSAGLKDLATGQNILVSFSTTEDGSLIADTITIIEIPSGEDLGTADDTPLNQPPPGDPLHIDNNGAIEALSE